LSVAGRFENGREHMRRAWQDDFLEIRVVGHRRVHRSDALDGRIEVPEEVRCDACRQFRAEAARQLVLVCDDDAIGLAAKLIKDHMAIFINFEEDTEDYSYQQAERAPLPRNDQLDRSVDELELSVRSYNCLKNAGIKSIRDLVQRSEREMLATKNFGKKSLGEIRDILRGMGLDFGMQFDEQGNPIPGSGDGSIEDVGGDDEDEFEAAVQ